MHTPRPILKRSTSAPSAEKHVVHFPPSPALTCTFAAHSPTAYDRSPIVVSPNVCALPERGGRTYVLDEATSPCSSRKRSSSKATRSVHPRALRDTSSIIPSMPPLVPDFSSESDESDGFPSPNLENQEFFFGPATQLGLKSQDNETADRISFLPYAPSYPYYSVDEENAYVEKPRRRKERRNDAPRDNDNLSRIHPSSDIIEEEATTPRRKSTKRRSATISTTTTSMFNTSLSLCDSFSSFALQDDGCLGGF